MFCLVQTCTKLYGSIRSGFFLDPSNFLLKISSCIFEFCDLIKLQNLVATLGIPLVVFGIQHVSSILKLHSLI